MNGSKALILVSIVAVATILGAFFAREFLLVQQQQPVSAGGYAVVDTGQNTCYDNSEEMDAHNDQDSLCTGNACNPAARARALIGE